MGHTDAEALDQPSSGSSNHHKPLYGSNHNPPRHELKPPNGFDIPAVFHTVKMAQPLIGGRPEVRAFACTNRRHDPARPQWPAPTAVKRLTMIFQGQRKTEKDLII